MSPYVQEFRIDGGIVHARLSGTYPNERLAIKENLFKPLIEECKRENCRDAMVDARQLQVEFDTIALFRAGVDAAAMNEFGLRVALIAREDMISSFFDDVIYNRAAQVQVFTDPQSAEAWIKERRQVEAA
ncbi:MAG TPA: hypothetical protein VFS13_20445 [Steroidobacteraceae bacterium]|nr:hypothetical protein [Steroidobacteraceae bacterium]